MAGLMRRLTRLSYLLSSAVLVAACALPLPGLTTATPGSATPGKQRFVGALQVALTAPPNSLDCPQVSDLNGAGRAATLQFVALG